MTFASRKETKLETGITIVSEQIPNANRAVISVAVRAGGIDEPVGKEGLAHILEHVVFRTPVTREGIPAEDVIEDLGGGFNAQTGLDRTVYRATVIESDLPRALALLADMTLHPVIREADVELEKTIVEDENCRGCPSCTMEEAYMDTAFPGQLMSRPVIGYEDSLASLTAEDLSHFHQQTYVAENFVVAVCADRPHAEIVDLVRAAFSCAPQRPAPPRPTFDYGHGDSYVVNRSDDFAAVIGYDLSVFSETEKNALYHFAEILGRHHNSLLMQELRAQRGLVYHVSAGIEHRAGHDLWGIYLQGPAARGREICTVAIDTFLKAAQGLSEDEIRKARRRHHVQTMLGLDDLEFRVEDMLTDILELGHAVDHEETYRLFQSMTSETLQAAATRMLALEPTIVVFAPMRRAPKPADLRARLRGVTARDRALQFLRPAS